MLTDVLLHLLEPREADLSLSMAGKGREVSFQMKEIRSRTLHTRCVFAQAPVVLGYGRYSLFLPFRNFASIESFNSVRIREHGFLLKVRYEAMSGSRGFRRDNVESVWQRE